MRFYCSDCFTEFEESKAIYLETPGNPLCPLCHSMFIGPVAPQYLRVDELRSLGEAISDIDRFICPDEKSIIYIKYKTIIYKYNELASSLCLRQ